MNRSEMESSIFDVLQKEGPLTLEQLVEKLTAHTWNQVFAAVDDLSREGRVRLRHADRFIYVVSLDRAA